MNDERITDKPVFNDWVFSYSRMFAINSGVFGEKSNMPVRLPGLFATVALPRLSLANQFSSYPIPYGWLSDSGTPDAGVSDTGVEKQQATNSACVYHYSQNTTIGIFAPSVLYRVLFEERSWRLPDVQVYSWLKKKKGPATETQTQWRSATEHLPVNAPPVEANKSNTTDQVFVFKRTLGAVFRVVSRSSVKEVLAAGCIRNFIHKAEISASDGHVQCLEKFLGSTAAKTSTLRMDVNASFIDALQGKTWAMDSTRLSVVRPLDLIRQTIKTLGAQGIEEQHQHKLQFEELQQLLQKAEQLTNQELRRLQQSIQELKSVMSARSQPVVISMRRPPSVYGRLK